MVIQKLQTLLLLANISKTKLKDKLASSKFVQALIVQALIVQALIVQALIVYRNVPYTHNGQKAEPAHRRV